MIQLSDVWRVPKGKLPNTPESEASVRADLDAAAAWVDAGALGEFGPTSAPEAPVGAGAGGGENSDTILEPTP